MKTAATKENEMTRKTNTALDNRVTIHAGETIHTIDSPNGVDLDSLPIEIAEEARIYQAAVSRLADEMSQVLPGGDWRDGQVAE